MSMFTVIFTRENNFCDFLFASPFKMGFAFLTSGFVHPYHLDESIPSFRGLVDVFIFTAFSIEISVSKQCRP